MTSWVRTEYGKVNHLLVHGVTPLTLCGLSPRRWYPPEPGGTRCAYCDAARGPNAAPPP